jgi:MoaA/NifB/PqqE/SkfB family radical SAM enzyme/SAM-dependent methyltransferase
VLDPLAPNWAATDEDGGWVLRQLRAGLTRDEVSYRFAKRAGVSLRRALELVEAFADEVGELAASQVSTPYRGRAHYLKPDRLREVWLHVTDRCNLACRHCLVSSGPAGERGLDTEAISSIIRQARELGADTFYLTGGEPLVRPDIMELLRLITVEHGAIAVVLTNGTLLDEELAGRLSRLPSGRLFLQVSLDGSCAERNDALRTKGSFERAVRGIRAARAAGLHVTIATVALRRNLDDLPAIAQVARSLGVGHMHLMWQHVRERGGRLPRASLRKLISAVRDLRATGRELTLTVDNFENVRRTVNGDPSIKYDLTNACWDSLALYRDGRVFPSACLVGIESEAAGSVLDSPLRRIWLESEQLARWRSRSVVESANGDPWRFLHGGGDPEQAFFAQNGGDEPAPDPYLPLHTELARLVVDETVAERRRLIGDGRAGLVVYQLMGDDGYGCPTESGVRNGGEHKVDFIHSNCVLIQDVIAKSRAQIRAYYAEAAREPKTEICQPISIDRRLLAHIPDDVIARSYGCGSPVLAAAPTEGETVLDLGSGAGMEAFIASRLVGREGRVIGVDMTPDMLRFSSQASRAVAQRLGYGNVSFARALLEALPLASGSVDAVISNCVINLSPEKLRVFAETRRVLKPGGRVVVADIVSRQALPPEIRFNPRLKGECIAGAMTERKLLSTLRKLGFVGIEVLRKNEWRTVDEIGFDTLTVRAYRPAAGVAAALIAPARDGALEVVTSPSAPRHAQDCMVCGAPLIYLDREAELKCHYCGQVRRANSHCEQGHFVCDACHASDHIGFINTFCRNTAATDPIAIFSGMRQSHLFPLHGPEHHALVPAAFLSAYRNSFGEPPQPRVEAAIDRGAALPGGTCAYWGGCAAALGIGIAYSAILRATPLSHEPRGVVQTVVSQILAEMGKYGSPRCCRRESLLALSLGCELSARYLPHALTHEELARCDQMALNRECIGGECPFHSASTA